MAGVSKHVSKSGTSWHTSHNTKSQGDVLFTYSLPDVEGVYFTKTSDEQRNIGLGCSLPAIFKCMGNIFGTRRYI